MTVRFVFAPLSAAAVLAAATFLNPASAAAEPLALTCDQTAQTLDGGPGTVLEVACPADCGPFTVWGTVVYSDDSSVCSAARHAGLVGPAGGTTLITISAGMPGYRGSTMNGVTTLDWGQWGRSFVFGRTAVLGCFDNAQGLVGGPGATWTVTCAPGCSEGGSVWGTGTYSDDSSVCRAAIHAGAATDAGGEVTLRILEGLSAYPGSTLNGVETLEWGEWSRSFSFEL